MRNFLAFLLLWALFPLFVRAAEPEFSTYQAQMSELDMIHNAKDLTAPQKEAVVRAYKKAEKAIQALRRQIAETQSSLFQAAMAPQRDPGKEKTLRQKLEQLSERERESVSVLFNELGKVMQGSRLDPHYLFRALLREGRRTGLELIR